MIVPPEKAGAYLRWRQRLGVIGVREDIGRVCDDKTRWSPQILGSDLRPRHSYRPLLDSLMADPDRSQQASTHHGHHKWYGDAVADSLGHQRIVEVTPTKKSGTGGISPRPAHNTGETGKV
jgi:hypothetical protein